MAVKAELELREILLSTGLVIPVKVEARGGRISALCREVPNQASKWMEAMQCIFENCEDSSKYHLCRQYVWKDGRMVFGWHVGIDADNAKDLEEHIKFLKISWEHIQPDLTPQPLAATSIVAQPTAPEPEEDVEEEEPELTPAQVKDLASRKANYQKKTTAPPRPPAEIGDMPQPPPGYEPELRIVFKGKAKDQKNRMVPVVVEEFPLPHVYTEDMNVPNERGRGAKTLG